LIERENFEFESEIYMKNILQCNGELVQLIEEKSPHILNIADDFKLLCEEYD